MRDDVARLGYLDGIRGLAAVWVLLAHCMILGGWYWPYFPDGMNALNTFVILSGYLMAYHERTGDPSKGMRSSIRSFYIRRFFRVAPVYYTMLAVSFALAGPIASGITMLQVAGGGSQDGTAALYQADASPLNIAMHLTFLFGLFPQYAATTLLPDWSISLEMQFYFAFPFIIASLRRFRYWIPIVCCVALSLATIQLLDGRASPVRSATSYYPHPSLLLLKLPLFLAGILTADAIALATRRGATRMPIVLAAAAITLAGWLSYWGATMIGVLLFLGLQHSQDGSRWRNLTTPITFLLGSKPAQFLGATSYGVYLLHGMCIGMAGHFLGPQAWFIELSPALRVAVLTVIVAAAAYPLATVLHYAVELPSIAWGRRIEKRFTKPVGTP